MKGFDELFNGMLKNLICNNLFCALGADEKIHNYIYKFHRLLRLIEVVKNYSKTSKTKRFQDCLQRYLSTSLIDYL